MSNTPVEPIPYSVPFNSFLVRATRDWIEANDGTPHLVISPEGVQPFLLKYLNSGVIRLNISSRATGNFHIDEQYVSFAARFSGVSQAVQIPIANILQIYDRENPIEGGMILPVIHQNAPVEPEPPKRPVFTVVK